MLKVINIYEFYSVNLVKDKEDELMEFPSVNWQGQIERGMKNEEFRICFQYFISTFYPATLSNCQHEERINFYACFL